MRSKIMSFLTLLLVFVVVAVFSSTAFAIDCDTCSASTTLTTAQAVQCGTNCAGNSKQTPATATKNLNDTVKSVIEVLSIIVAVVSIIMVMLGGFRYVTSSGSQEAVAGGKRTITYAVVGLVIATLAQVLVHFVLAKTKATIK